MIITGDFNSLPTSITGRLFNGEFPIPQFIEEKKFKKLILNESIKIFNNHSDLDYEMFLNVYSRYKLFSGEIEDEGDIEDYEKGFPDFSNYTEGFKGFLDHILVKKGDFEIFGLKRLPSFEDIKGVTKGLPYDEFPSDHLPIGVELIPI